MDDLEYLTSVFSDPVVWDGISDDISRFTDKRSLAALTLSAPSTVCISPDRNGAVIIFTKKTSVLWEVHQQALPAVSGRTKVKTGKDAISWMFDNTACHKLVGYTPEFNKAALRMAALCGFRQEGVLTKSYLYNGKLHDQIITGISKDGWSA